jgi:hypothetical protein
MNHVTNAFTRRLHRGPIGDAPDVKINLVAHSRQVRFLAARKIIEYHHFLAALNQFIHNVRADESGAAGHEIMHCKNPLGENACNGWPVIYRSGTLDPGFPISPSRIGTLIHRDSSHAPGCCVVHSSGYRNHQQSRIEVESTEDGLVLGDFSDGYLCNSFFAKGAP